MTRWNKIERVIWAAVTASAVTAYFFALGRIPAGLFIDETSVGYNARAIGRTLADQYGVTLPLFFRALDDYKSPVYVYSAALCEALFGPSPFSVRLPAALYMLGTAALVFLLVRALTGRATLARWMAALALLVPSLFIYGRHAVSEVSSLPFWLALALLALVRFERAPTWGRAALSGAALGFCTYTYTTARILAPLYVAAAAACFWTAAPASRRKLPALLGAAALLGLPMGAYMLLHPGELDKRFQLLSITADHPPVAEAVRRFFGAYFQHLGSLDFLFRTGDLNTRHNIGVGFLPVWMALPLLFGFWAAWRRRASATVRFLLAAVLLAPIPVSLTTEGLPHASRMLHYALLALLLASLAIADWLETGPARPLVALATAGALLEGGLFLERYFVEYPGRAQAVFAGGISEALQVAFAHRNGSEPLYVPSRFFEVNGTHLEFFGDLDPVRRRTLGYENLFTLDAAPVYPAGALVIVPGAWRRSEPVELLGTSPSAADGSPLYSVYRVR